MLSAISVITIAVKICNNHELKREILCAPELDYGIYKGDYITKKEWNETVKEKAMVTITNLDLPKMLQEKVMNVILPIGMRMLTWAEYHEGTLGLSREYSINFLNTSYFTQQGIIDNKKAAEELMKDENLSLDQKCKLAYLYCFTDHIPTLYRQMTIEDKKLFYTTRPQWFNRSDLDIFLSYVTDEVDITKGEKAPDEYSFEKAVRNGSKAAVEYCLERTNIRRKKDDVVDAAVEAVRNRIIIKDDSIVFRDERYDASNETWVPNDYFVDIVSFLLSKMGDGQKIEFLKKDIEDHRRSRVLEYFLYWPYQDNFMKTAGLMWEFLPESNYAVLLLKICDMIESKEEIIKCGEENSYDYRGLLKEFWCQSPERYKRYVLSNQVVNYGPRSEDQVKACVGVLRKLLMLKNFTYEDSKNIKLILASATDKERENLLSSKEFRGICIGLMEAEEWAILGWFLQNCFSSKEEVGHFKRDFIFTKEAQRTCINFVKNDKCDAAESVIKWSDLREGEINSREGSFTLRVE